MPTNTLKAMDDAYGERDRSWSGACVNPDGSGRAATKDLLIERYKDVLEREEQVQFKDLDQKELRPLKWCKAYRGTPRPGSPLEPFQLDAIVVLCRVPGPDDNGFDKKHYAARYLNGWYSFVVQKVRLPEGVNALLLDTSDFGTATAARKSRYASAAERGAVRQWQQNAIRVLLENENLPLVMMGHSPWGEMTDDARRFLIAQKHFASYVSAHTHLANALLIQGKQSDGARGDGLLEINVGSTTDWPLQALRLGIQTSSQTVTLWWKSLGASPDDERPEWLRDCEKNHQPDSPAYYMLYLASEDARKYSQYDVSHDPFGRLKDVLHRAEVRLDSSPDGSLATAGGTHCAQLSSPSTRMQFDGCVMMDSLAQRIRALEHLMEQNDDARAYGVCEAYFAAKAFGAAPEGLYERQFHYERASGSANAFAGARLTLH